MAVGHNLVPCTARLQHDFIENKVGNRPHLEGRRIVIVDTPSFDDSSTDDKEILRRIAVWLASS
jgi:hypothetical protein